MDRGISLRTAQRRYPDHPDIKKFFQVGADSSDFSPTKNRRSFEIETVLAYDSPLAPPPPPPSIGLDQSTLAEPERMKNAAWLMWAEHFAMWRECLGGTEKGTGRVIPRDVAMAGAQAGLLMKLRADFEKAQAKHTQWEVDQRRLIPANEFHAYRSGFLIPLRNMLSNMPAEQAILVNPANQQQAIKGGTEYLLNRLMPQIQQCIDALDQLTPHLNAA